ncbi:MAG: PQQ-binding-like beta-propeller repeat protein [Pirellula sp.]|nr:PQQ-binding-like beta-propeller repeat protein [Pirellula sp.]
MRRVLNWVRVLAMAGLSVHLCGKSGFSEDWTQFRGGAALSVASESRLPESWPESPAPAWRTAIDGSGWSQPIIVGDKVFITTAVSASPSKPKGMMGGVTDPSTMGRAAKPKDPVEWRVVCLSLANGEIQWQSPVAAAVPAYGKHASNTFATETPAASADTVYAFFGAAGVLAALDFEGKLKWSKSFEPQKMNNDFGTGSSVLLADDRVLVQLYNEESAVLYCMSTADGQELWRGTRDKGSAWSTPILWKNIDRTEVVTAGSGSVIAYDLMDGSERWRVGGLDTSFSCSLVADPRAVYYGTASPGSRGPIGAVGAGHVGNLTPAKDQSKSEGVLWSGFKSGAGMPSPVVAGDYVYFFGNTITCYETQTGKEVYRKRAPGGTLIAGCPVVAGDKIYAVNESGNILVFATGPEFQVLAELKTGNKDEVYWATPAIVQDSLLVRSSDAVYCYR